MNLQRYADVHPKLVKVIGAVIVGLSVGTLVPPDPVFLSGLGTIPGLLASLAGLLLGGLLYSRGPGWLSQSPCGCENQCGCD